MKKREKKKNSKFLGITLIVVSITVFVISLQNKINSLKTPKVSQSTSTFIDSTHRITADKDAGELYLWGYGENMNIKASTPITHRYDNGFYIISIQKIDSLYSLEVFDGEKRVGRFSYRPGETYPIYPY